MGEKDKTQQELEAIQDELISKGMSRRKFLNRLKVAGVGFGAFAVLSNEAANASTGDRVSLQSTNPAIGDIIEEGRAENDAEGENNTEVAYRRYRYRRYYRRGYRRYYRRGYRRYYSRYRRYYSRYRRYNGGYRRFYF